MSNSHDRRNSRRSRPPRIGQRRTLRLERLCDRRVLAAITGMVFEDANQTLRRDAGEAGLEDRIVYLDLNQDGRPGFGEPLQRTTADGGFQFDNLAIGDYVVRLYNGTESQRQTYPVAPQLDDALLQISDVQLHATSSDGSAVFGLVDDSVVRIDPQSGDIQTIDLGGIGGAIHPLPDGSLLVLADTAEPQTPSAWIVSFDESTVTTIDFGLYAGESGWSTATLNANGDGVLTANSTTAEPTALRRLKFENGQLTATPTALEVAAGTTALSNAEGTLTLFAVPQEEGLQLIQWSNATGEAIPGSITTIANGIRLEAFDEASGLTVVRNNADELLVLDAANGYALLDRIDGLHGPVVLDGLRDVLYGQDADTNLVVYDIQARQSTAVVNMPLPRAGGMTLIDNGQAILLGGDYAVLRVQLDEPDGHRVNLPNEEASADVLFGLFVREANTAPAFQSSPTFYTAEDTPLTRPEPTLLVHGKDEDANDQFIVLKATNPGAGTASVGAGGDFVYAPAQDVFGQDRFDILLHDGRSASEPTAVRINIAPVNDPIGPILVDIQPVIPENILPGVPLGAITIVNVDAGEQIDIQVTDPRFEIQDGQLVLAEGAVLDFENRPPYELTIVATQVIIGETPEEDYYELITTTVPIQIEDVNEPVLGVNLISPISLAENSPGPTWLSEVYAIDQDYEGDYSYEVDDKRFEFVDNRLRLKPDAELDHETDDGMEITITVHDGPFEASDKFAVEVLDMNEMITGVAFVANTITERIEGAVVGQMQVDDPDQPTTAQLTVDDNRFEFVGTTLKLRDGVSVSSDISVISLVLTVTDNSYPPFSQDVPVDLTVLENPLPFHNQSYPLDADGSGTLDPSDVLLIINYLNQYGPGPIEQDNVSGAPVYYDVNGDSLVTPLDALLVINQLNIDNRNQTDPTVGGENESPQSDSPQGEATSDGLADGQPATPPVQGSRKTSLTASSAAVDQAVLSYYVFDDEDEEDEPAIDESPQQLN